jgi:transposase
LYLLRLHLLMRLAPSVVLVPEERSQLETWARGRSAPHRLVLRSQIVLRAAQGQTNREITEALGTNPITVGRWRTRFALLRLEGIERDAPRPGRNPSLDPHLVERIVQVTLHERPKGETHWSTRSLAERLGVSHMTIHRVWKDRHLQPHLARSFELSPDPQFEQKLLDVVGLYLNPPEKAVVFSVDEKPQVQALERKQTVLPIGPKFPEGRPHEYKRNGTIDLFAALNILDGTVVAQFHHRHRHQEFLTFLRALDERTPPELSVHVILDNLSAHMTEEVERWLRNHPRFQFHFTPTHASWLNAVEGWFSKLTKKGLSRGSFRNVLELQRAIREFVESSNERASPFVWTKSSEEILRKVRKIQRLSVTPH